LGADRDIIEEWKWTVGSLPRIIASPTPQRKVKRFARRASLPDPDKLNAGLEGNARRAIDFFDGDKINSVL
jgi:hypothetical protein